MNKKDYFSQLLTLYEAASVDDSGENDIDRNQTKIADNGEDALGTPQQAQEPIQQPEQPQENDVQSSDNDLDDAAYLTQDSASNDASTQSGENRQKLVELFELTRNLLNYGETFSETLDDVELQLLDDESLERCRKYQKALNELVEKVKNYLENTFNSESYEQALYAYIVLRTELLTIIKALRNVLKLNEVEDK